MSGAVKLSKNADHDKYEYSGYGIGFDADSDFSINGAWDKNVEFGVDNSLSVYTDNRKKDIVVLAEGTMDGLDISVTVVAKYSAKIFLSSE